MDKEDIYIWKGYKFGDKILDALCKFEKAKTNDKNEPGGYFVWVKANWIDRHPKYCSCFKKLKPKKLN
jgi:hypothetical protein